MNEFQLNILSPEGQLFAGRVEAATLPGSVGRFTILPHHAPIVSSLVGGELSYVVSGKVTTLRIAGGFVEMSDGVADVCVEEEL